MTELMEEAVKKGADAVGGLDPIGIDRDPKGQLDAIFAVADRHGCEIDIHLHDTGEIGAITVEMMAERTKALGMQGKVAVSHGYFLGDIDRDRFAGITELLVDNDIVVMDGKSLLDPL